MTYVPLGKSDAKRLGGLVPTLDIINMYAEATETNQVSGYDLLTRPVLALSSTPSAGPCRGLFNHESTYGILGGFYAALAGALYKNGAGLGALSGDVLPIQMAFGDTEALVASGDVLQYTDGQGLSDISFPDDQKVISVAYLNGYYLAVPVGQIAEDGARYIYYSDPLLTPADPGFFTADRRVGAVMTGGPILRVEANGPEFRAWKTDGVEVFQPTGLDDATDPPFQRVSGREYNRGTYQPYAITNIGETTAYVDSEYNVNLAGVTPTLISTSAISERIAAAAVGGSIFLGSSVNWLGHELYLLTLGSTTTLVCDVSLSPPLWYEWTNANGSAWSGVYAVTTAMGITYMGDRVAGNLYTLTEASPLDYQAMTMTQRGTGVYSLNQRTLVTSISVDCAVGTSAGGIELFTSTDQGQTYDSHGAEAQNDNGSLTRVRWTRLGQFEPPMAMVAFQSTAAVRQRISNVRANDPF